MIADGPVLQDGQPIQEARASAAKALTLLSWNILIEAPEGSSNSSWIHSSTVDDQDVLKDVKISKGFTQKVSAKAMI